MPVVTRQNLLDALQRFVTDEAAVRAAWEGGSVAFKRADEWSDIDLNLLVADGTIPAVWSALEQALTALGPFTDRYVVPEPAWHGLSQRFFRIAGTSEFLMIDVVVTEVKKGPALREVERHGTARVLVDKDGALAEPAVFDRAKHEREMAARLAAIRASFPMFQTLVAKEIKRGRATDAMAFYVSQTLRPLVELLRIRHCPDRYDYGLRYLNDDLPADVHARLAPLVFVGSFEDLERKRVDAAALFAETLAALDAQSPATRKNK